MLLIVMLLSNFMSLQAQTNNGSPSTGSLLKADTTVATVPIYLIKQANAKMIERIYLIEINNQQDSIILMKNQYIFEQQKIINDFQKRIDDANRINQTIADDLDKQKRRNKIMTYGGGSVIIALILGLIIK